jgi:hypothetical protein
LQELQRRQNGSSIVIASPSFVGERERERYDARMQKGSSPVAALILAVGIVAAALVLAGGIVRSRNADRYVTVKGISERDVKAGLAIWPLRFVATDDNLDVAQAGIEKAQATVLAFLARHGIPASMTEIQGLEVTDVLTNPYRSGPATSRYIIAQTLMVRAENADLVAAASQKVGELVDAGVVLSAQNGPITPTYLFTKLSDLKPEMIGEATANARRAAEQFASDSGSRILGIRRANQGVFEILPRDRVQGMNEEGQIQKTVRVVTTLDYQLAD